MGFPKFLQLLFPLNEFPHSHFIDIIVFLHSTACLQAQGSHFSLSDYSRA